MQPIGLVILTEPGFHPAHPVAFFWFIYTMRLLDYINRGGQAANDSQDRLSRTGVYHKYGGDPMNEEDRKQKYIVYDATGSFPEIKPAGSDLLPAG